MKISKIHIENFRSIVNGDIAASDFNVFVGRNNHGKTNIFHAIEWFYSGKGDLNEIRNVEATPDAEIVVEITFSGVKAGMDHISNEENQTKLRNVLKDADTMTLRRSSKAAKDRMLWTVLSIIVFPVLSLSKPPRI
jgi:recombinational DNA repair ATPase RecF